MNDFIELALRRFKLAESARKKQLEREISALKCQVAEHMWPDEARALRASQTVNGVPIPARPMISIPTLDQPIQLVLNQERQAHLGVSVHPLNEDATDDTAEVLEGLYRKIQRDSRATIARTWAYERAIKAGRGVYRVLTEYDPESNDTKDQRIVIKRLLWQGAAYFDPAAEEPDWSDGDWAFIVRDEPMARYKRLYPTSSVAGMDSQELVGLGNEQPGWVGGADEASRTVRIAEYWYHKADGKVWCAKINAAEVLEDNEWNGQYIPIIPVIGRELQPFDAERRWVGIIEPNIEAARLFNYAASGAVESAALEPKAPFDVDPEEIEGYEAFWLQANTRNFPYLPRKKFLHGQWNGAPIGRIQADASKMQINMALLAQAREFIHAGTGAYEASLGQQSANAKSGRSILALQQQHEQGNSNYLDNLAEISMTYEAKVVLDLIPRIYDRPGRLLQILDAEDNPKQIMFNQPFLPGPGGQPQPAAVTPEQIADPNHPAKHYDLKKGRYGVSVSVGKTYRTRLEQGADEMGQLFQAAPQLFAILGDLYLKFRDFPGHQEAAERIKKMLPPQLQEPDQQQNAQAQMAQMQSVVQQQGQLLQAAQQYIEKEQAKHQADLQKAQLDHDAKIQIEQMSNATALAIAKINAAVKGLVVQQEAENEAMALAQTQVHETLESERVREFQAEQAAQQHQRALEQGEQSGQQQAALAQQQADQQAETQADQQETEE
jgi:hypothetical protein